jgi:hypothetical protein
MNSHIQCIYTVLADSKRTLTTCKGFRGNINVEAEIKEQLSVLEGQGLTESDPPLTG